MSNQNIYDNDLFFDKFIEFSNSYNGIDSLYEYQYLIKLLPNLKGLNILDVGCGAGLFCRDAINKDANYVHGIDISKNMINQAIKLSNNENDKLKYEIQDLESLKLDFNNYFDLIFSRFVFHYIINLESLFQTLYNSLKIGGNLVFVIEHPVKTTSKSFSGVTNVNLENGDSIKVWPVSNYNEEGERSRTWLNTNNIIKQHKTISTYLNTLIKCGFTINHLDEIIPSKEELDSLKDSKFIKDYENTFVLIVKVTKNK